MKLHWLFALFSIAALVMYIVQDDSLQLIWANIFFLFFLHYEDKQER